MIVRSIIIVVVIGAKEADVRQTVMNPNLIGSDASVNFQQ